MRLRNLILLVVIAALTFGGTFTCRATQDSSKFTENPQTPK
jgi:hypothetical protein